MSCVVRTALTASLLLLSFGFVGAQQPTVSRAGVQVPLYKASYALVIGVSQYRYWPSLPNVLKESEQVAAALKRQGFQVRTITNPNGDSLQNAFRDFFADYGRDPDHRLIVYFAGHGHSIGESGFLVPADAPDPTSEPSLFMKRAQSMSQLVSASREYKARHALYVFDSCFSGAIFSTRANPPIPRGMEDISRYLTGPASEPVRQFITAGSETQRVPEISQFTPLFIHAIEGRIPELNRGGFVSSKDLGLWMSRNLSLYVANQTPRSGTILDSRFDRGDFVFSVGAVSAPDAQLQPTKLPQPTHTPTRAQVVETRPSTPTGAACFTFNGKRFCE